MDNITHSLIGLVEGEFFFSRQNNISLKNRPLLRRSVVLTASVVANNFPDLDFLFFKLTPGPLGYLVQHRGYTHTALGLIPQAIIICLFGFIIRVSRKIPPPRLKLTLDFIAIVIIGLISHLVADSWNTYGIHPFWPWNSKWYYGDAVFIAEPWIWFTLIPPLCMRSETWIGKSFFLALTLLLGVFVFRTHFVAVPMMAFIASWTGFLFFVFQFLRTDLKAGYGLLFLTFIVSLFFIVKHHVYVRSLELAWQKDAESKILDVIVSPLPGNFICWSVVSAVIVGEPPIYKLRGGIFSLLPNRITPEDCSNFHPNRNFGVNVAKKKPGQDPSLIWTHSFKMDHAKVMKLYKEDCRIQAFFKFARAPYLTTKKGEVTLGDFRYSRPEHTSFTEMTFPKLNKGVVCPPHVPNWREPRKDLIDFTL